MEQKNMLLFINISTFILLPWICKFYNDLKPLNKNLYEKCNLCRKINTRNYRLLAKYKQDSDSCIENFKREIQHNKVKQNKCLSNNKKGSNRSLRQLCKSSLYIQEYDKNVKKNKCAIPKTKKYSNFEEKIFKELDYKDYLIKINIIEDKEYKKISRKKLRIRTALILLFFLVLIVPILDLSLEKFTKGGLLGLLGLLYPSSSEGQTLGTNVQGHLFTLLSATGMEKIKVIFASPILLYCVPFLIFVVIFILGMIYYYKKVIKYENMKFRKRLNR
ncbi:fam-l protein [Plasmodium brasilianum]|uniref:Fam-l protein n=1 Tax=Plasmodium brasilianum TaxID=5824 RepID=A0ACB9YDD4_PLABR|nr:fam-l protein [Plasmodium brasilianum]